MNNYKEIKELYFDEKGLPKLTSEDVKMPFLRDTLKELYAYLQTSGDCTPTELKNIEDFLEKELAECEQKYDECLQEKDLYKKLTEEQKKLIDMLNEIISRLEE